MDGGMDFDGGEAFNEGGQDFGAKRPRLSSPEDGEMCFKLLVSPNTAGKIIGRGGAEIKAMRDQLGVGVHIHKSDNVFPKAPMQQITLLFGTREVIDSAFDSIVAKIVETEQASPEAGPLRVSCLISKNAVSAIIGHKGAVISELRLQSGCNISADTENFAGEQLVHVVGHMDKLPMALACLTPLVEKSGDSLQFAEQKYGKGGKGMFDGGKGCSSGKGFDKGKGKGFDKGFDKGFGKSKGKGHIDMSASPYGGAGQMHHHQASSYGGAGQMHHQQAFVAQAMPRQAINEEQEVMECQTAIQFSIPKDAISRVLGKGGSSSKQITQMTGAHLKIEPREEDGLVTLTGILHGVHKAHCMVVGRVLSQY